MTSEGKRAVGPRWFWAGVAIAGVAALAIRVAYVDHVASRVILPFDGQYNHDVANAFVAGRGWIDTNLLHTRGIVRPTAYFPPLFGFVLAGASWLGADSVHAHQLVSCAIGVLTVVVAAVLARRVASPATGLVAAGIVAIHPLLFDLTGALMPETLYIPLAGAAVLSVYVVKRHPSYWNITGFGALCGLAALTRSDGLGLVIVLGVPLVVSLRPIGPRRWKLAAVGVLALVVVLAPWTIRNALTFDKPVAISNNSGTLLAGANCDLTYYGPHLGRWALQCPDVPDVPARDDESVVNSKRRNLGITYALDHASRLPYVALVRVVRTWVPASSNDQTQFEVAEGRDAHWQWLGELLYLAGIPFAIAGVFVLRRRKVAVWPLLAPFVLVCIVSATGYGSQRFRAAAEVPLIVLTAVGITATAWKLRQAARPGRTPDPALSAGPGN